MDRLSRVGARVRYALGKVGFNGRMGPAVRSRWRSIALLSLLAAGAAHAQVGTESASDRTATRQQLSAGVAAAAPTVNVTGKWHGYLSAPGDSSAAQWAEELVLSQDASGNVTGSRKTVALGASVQFVWSATGAVSGNQLTLNDVSVSSQSGSTTPCKVTLQLSVTPDGSSFSGTWAAPTQSGCNGGTFYASRYGAASTKRLGSGLPCDGGEGEALLAGGGSGGTAGGNADGSSCAEEMGAPRVGDPIDASTGNFFLQEDDFAGGEWLSFRRFYNSGDGVSPTSLGFNWRHTYDRSLQISGSPASSIVMLRPDGKQETFTKVAGSWTTDLPVDVLTETKDAQGVLTGYRVFIGGMRHTETYSLDGRLLSVTGQDGQGVTLTYITSNSIYLLKTVTDTTGRRLTFSYDSSSLRISLVTFPDGTYASFNYVTKSGNLGSVVYADNSAHNYGYDEVGYVGTTDLPHALTGISDGLGNRYESITYDAKGRATISSFIGNVGVTKIAYNDDGSSDITYPLGNTVHMGFTSPAGVGRVSTLSTSCAPDCGQPWKTRTYDALGFPATATDFNANVLQTRYNAYSLLEQSIEAQGTANQRTTSTTWDLGLRRPLTETILDAGGDTVNVTSWAYNAAGQMLARCEADPAVSGATSYVCAATGAAPAGVRRSTYAYCSAVDTTQCPRVGLLLSQTGPRQDLPETTTYRYYLTAGTFWTAGDLQSITDALGHTTTIAMYDAAGRIKRIVDANGVVTDLTYDSRGRPFSRSIRANADGSSSLNDANSTVNYDGRGLIIRTTDADGVALSYTYDTAHRLSDITDGASGKTHFTYDASGNVTKIQNLDRNGAIVRNLARTFDTLGRWVGEMDGLNQPTFNAGFTDSFDGNGNPLHAATATNEYRRSYDAMNRVITALDGVGAADAGSRDRLSVTSYDARGDVSGVSDPDSLATTYQHTAFREVTSQTSPDTGASDFVFNENGQIVSRKDAKGQVVTVNYDVLGRPATATFPSASDNIAWFYDEGNTVTGCAASAPIGRLTRVVQAGVTTVYCYDRHGNVSRKSQTQGSDVDTVDYTYTNADRLKSVTLGNGTQLTYTRDARGVITGVQSTASGQSTTLVSSADYLPFGPLKTYTLGGQTVTLAYDANYALTDINATAFQLHLKRDAGGRVAAIGPAAGVPVATETYAYDGASRLLSVSNPQGVLESYSYNKTGDRLSKSGAGLSTGSYALATGSHRLTGVGTATRGYDANGSTSSLDFAGSQWTLSYDGLNRVREISQAGTVAGTYAYNALGQRVLKQMGAAKVRFIYDEDGRLLAEVGTTTRVYAWMDDVPVAVIDTAAGASTISYIYADNLGTPRVVTNTAGVVEWTWARQGSPFGENVPVRTGSFDLNLRFPGQYFDAESGFVYNVNRYYDPSTGRYLSADPLGLNAGLSLYQYVDGSPLADIDPLGLCKNCTVMARVLKGNKNLVGKGGAFNGSPSRLAKYGVTADSAAVIPSQFGLTRDQMRPLIDQISGTLQDGTKFKFNRVRDVVDDAKTRKAHGWHVDEFQENVMNRARAANGGLPTFVLELPGLKKDPGVIQVKLTVPDNVNCPEGTL